MLPFVLICADSRVYFFALGMPILRAIISGLVRTLESDLKYISMLRGMLLYGGGGIFLFAIIGIFFSEDFTGFIKYLPLAAILVAAVVSFQVSLWPVKVSALIKVVCWVVVVVYLLGGGLNAYIGAKIYDGPQYDGAFQLYFPLKRMAAGEWPGKDFFYFHGQLIPVLIYPFFKLLGGDFFASQFASKLVDLIVPLAYFIIFRWLGFNRVKSLLASLLLIGLLVTDRFTFGTQNPIEGVHIYSLRSLLPFLYMSYLARQLADEAYLRAFSSSFYKKTVFIQASIFVISFYLGSEQAFYLLAAMMLANLVAIGFKPWRVILATILLVIVSISLLLLSNELIFGSQKPLLYLGEISKNQAWFYSSYPNEFLHSALDFSRYRSSTFKVSAKIIVCIIGLPALLGLTWLLLPRKDKQIFFFALIGGAYGLIGLTSFIASYSGEQYADNALKTFLIVGIILLIKLSFKEANMPSISKKLYRIPGDLMCAAPILLIFTLFGCIYTTVAALKIPNNYRLQKILESGLFMELPELDVKLPFGALSLQTNERYHSSQFLALEYAQGNRSARVFYPEYTFVNGFNEGVKQLYRLTLTQNIPSTIAVGDFCEVNGAELSIEDIDRESKHLYFNISVSFKKHEDKLLKEIVCYRKPAEKYTSFDGRALYLEHGIFDKYFYDGLYRGRKLQIKIKTFQQSRMRVGDDLILAGVSYKITAVHGNGVIVLDSAEHPLPYAFDHGLTFTVSQKILPYNDYRGHFKIYPEEEVVTRVNFNDKKLLSEFEEHKKLFVVSTNEYVNILNVDAANATIDLAGYINLSDIRYGLHFGDLNKSAFSAVGGIAPVFQFMKGILSAKNYESAAAGSNIDFMFHTFSSSLLAEYMDGLIRVSPDFISIPSGRYVNNLSWYDNWLVRARWPAYEYLLHSYDPVAESKFESFWRRSERYENAASWTDVNISQEEGRQTFDLGVHKVLLKSECELTAYEVELDYKISGWQRIVPLLGGSARHLALINDRLAVPLTFNPNEQVVRFPVFPLNGTARIQIKTISPFGVGTSINISAARYRQLNLPIKRIAAIVGRSESSICP